MVRRRFRRHRVHHEHDPLPHLPPPPPPPPPSSRPTRLTRSTTDRKVGGVAGGLAEYLGVDPLAVRLGFAIGSLFSAAGLIAYILLLAFVPEQDAPAVARPVAA